jgi:hypothetical protein
MAYEIIHEARTYRDKRAIVFYMYDPKKGIAKAIPLIPPGIPLRDVNGRALETGLFTTKFDKNGIISRLNSRLNEMGVTIDDREQTCITKL